MRPQRVTTVAEAVDVELCSIVGQGWQKHRQRVFSSRDPLAAHAPASVDQKEKFLRGHRWDFEFWNNDKVQRDGALAVRIRLDKASWQVKALRFNHQREILRKERRGAKARYHAAL